MLNLGKLSLFWDTLYFERYCTRIFFAHTILWIIFAQASTVARMRIKPKPQESKNWAKNHLSCHPSKSKDKMMNVLTNWIHFNFTLNEKSYHSYFIWAIISLSLFVMTNHIAFTFYYKSYHFHFLLQIISLSLSQPKANNQITNAFLQVARLPSKDGSGGQHEQRVVEHDTVLSWDGNV